MRFSAQGGYAESFRFLRMAGTLQVSFVKRKTSILPVLTFIAGAFLQAGEPLLLHDASVRLQPPAGWQRLAVPGVILRGPGTDLTEAPRLTISIVPGDVNSNAASMRDGWRRVSDGCDMIDDDDEPIGGRVWRRIRVRFAVGPLAFGQCAWIGQVNGRTMVAVLSAPDDHIVRHLVAASTTLASISMYR